LKEGDERKKKEREKEKKKRKERESLKGDRKSLKLSSLDIKDSDSISGVSFDHPEVFRAPEQKASNDTESIDIGTADIFVKPKSRASSFPSQNILLDIPVSFGLFSCVAQFSSSVGVTNAFVGSYLNENDARYTQPIVLNVLIACHISLPIWFLFCFIF
jgi:hypothetical protein